MQVHELLNADLGVWWLLAGLRLLRMLLLWSIALRLPLLSGFALPRRGSGAARGLAGGRVLEVVTPHPAVAAAAYTHVSLTYDTK